MTTPAAIRPSRPGGPERRSAGPASSTRPVAASRHGVGFWLIAASLLTVMAFSAAPAPLYPLYQQRDHFSTFMVTVVFAVYAVGVAVSLLLAGHVSDWVGRKRILIPAIALEAVSAVLFLAWPDLAVLILARLINGIGVGMITATATAYLHELHSRHRPDATQTRFEMVSTAANIGGLGVGPLVTGFLAEYVTQPLRVPYLVFAILLLLAVGAVGLTPETVEARLVRPSWRPQRIRVQGDRTRYVIAVAGAFSTFAILGLFTSLAPGFVAGTLHHNSRLLAGVTVFLVFGAAAVSQAATDWVWPGIRSATGLVAEAVGLAIVAAGMGTANLAVFLVGGAVAGAGGGVLFKSAVGSVAAMASPALRGEALAGLFLFSYAGMIVAAVGMGIAVEFIAATTAMYWFTAVILALLAAISMLLLRVRAGQPHEVPVGL
jgi:MFS family permease